MHVFGIVVGRQVRRQLLRWSVIVLVAVVASVAALAASMGVRVQALRSDRYAKLLQQVVQEQTRAPGFAMGWEIEPALRVVRPPVSAAAIVRGVDASSPMFWDFGPAGVVPATPVPLHDADEISPAIDFEFIVRVLLGLMTLILATNSLGMVRPQGELEGLRSFPISGWSVWVGQWAGTVLVALVAWMVTALAAVATAAALATDAAASEMIFAAATRLILPSLAYLAVMASLGAAIAAFVSNTAGRLIAVLVVWLVVAVLAPTTLQSIAAVTHPVSSLLHMTTERDAAVAVEIRSAETDMGDVLAKRAGSEAFPKMFDTARYPELDPVYITHAREARRQAVAIEEAWRGEERAHDIWLDHAEWFSPASLYWRAATGMARTGRSDRRAWDAATQSYEQTLQNRLFDNRPRVNVRLPVDRGRELLLMTRHDIPHLRDLPTFDPMLVSPIPSHELVWPMAVLWFYSLLLLAVSALWANRRPA